MKEEEKLRLKELKEKAERTDEENTELEALKEKEFLSKISDEVEKGTKKILKESGALTIDKDGVKITMVKAEEDKLTPEMKLTKQIQAIYQQKFLHKTVDPMTVGTPADGGYLVPDITAPSIIELASTYGQARQLFNVMPMGQNAIVMPKYLTGATAYWVNESSAITASKPTLGYVKMTPHKVAAIVPVSRELMEGAVPNISTYIMNLIAKSFGAAEDTQFFAGSGSPLYGLFYISNTFANAHAITGVNVNTLAHADLMACINGVDQALLEGAVWMYHRSIDVYIRGLKDKNDRPLFIDGYAGRPDTLLGYPVQMIEKATSATTANATVSTPFIALGNPKAQLFGETNNMVIDVTKSGYIASTEIFTVDDIAIRVIRSVTNAVDSAGTANGLADSFSIIKTAAA